MFGLPDMIRKYLIKLILLVVVIGGLQITITWLMPIHGVPEIQHLDEMLIHGANVVYFGDSIITSFAKFDQNKKSISTMLQNKQPNLLIARVSHNAYHMGLYLEYARYIVAQENLPQAVIIPINLRTFSPEWDMRPEYQFEKEARFLQNNNNLFIQSFNKPLSIFRWYKPEITRQQYETTPIYNGTRKVGIVRDFERMISQNPTSANIENSLIYFYLYQLNADHRKLQSMIELVDIYRAHDIDVIFYVTPIDYQIGESYFGEHFTEQVAQNIALITSTLQERDVILLDLSFSLTSEFFDWQGYPNEHLDENGRNFIAEQLSQELDFLQN